MTAGPNLTLDHLSHATALWLGDRILHADNCPHAQLWCECGATRAAWEACRGMETKDAERMLKDGMVPR